MSTDEIPKDEVTFRPVTLAEWADLQTLFSERGQQNGCWCMYWRVRRADFFRDYGEPHRAAMQRIIASGRVPGILAYHQGQPVGWCSVAPREDFPVLDRSRTLKRVDDQPVWSIVCFYVSRSYRRRGLSRMLIEAAVEYARGQGARIVEAYPVTPGGAEVEHGALYTGVQSTFEGLGFREVVRRSSRRPIMRLTIEAPIQTEECAG